MQAGESDRSDQPSPVWERIDQQQAQRGALNHAAIAAAAIRVADGAGLEALSMRRVADELAVSAMGLYRYVANKEELLQLMVDLAYEDLASAAWPSRWRAAIKVYADGVRALSRRHPWLARVDGYSLAVSVTPNRLAAAERVLEALVAAGLGADDAVAALEAVASFTHGAVASELTQARLVAEQGWQTRAQARRELAPAMSYLLSSGRYPAYAEQLRKSRRKDDFDWRFRVGLEAVIAGIAARFRI